MGVGLGAGSFEVWAELALRLGSCFRCRSYDYLIEVGITEELDTLGSVDRTGFYAERDEGQKEGKARKKERKGGLAGLGGQSRNERRSETENRSTAWRNDDLQTRVSNCVPGKCYLRRPPIGKIIAPFDRCCCG